MKFDSILYLYVWCINPKPNAAEKIKIGILVTITLSQTRHLKSITCLKHNQIYTEAVRSTFFEGVM